MPFMKKLIVFLPLILILIAGCSKEELPAPEAIHVKFVNQTGHDLSELYVNNLSIGEIRNGSSTSSYFTYPELGEQFGYALVEAVGTIQGEKHYASQACQGVCGTASAPHGKWLDIGYYKIAIRLAPPGKYIEFVML